ncbi:MAG TPA: BamA/TamA family outer membrane protein [Puia sp.]|nr:BamA/TamA family outer membrane protein [Puia sp.]
MARTRRSCRILIAASLVWTLLLPRHLHAQKDTSRIPGALTSPDTDTVNSEGYPQKDLVDVFRSISKKKTKNPGTTGPPAKYHFSIVPAIGYTLSTGFAGILASNVAFFTADPKTTNESNIAMQVVYSQYAQLTIPIIVNWWTKDNRYNITADWRYYKYPQDTYGLGGHSSLDNADRIDYSHIRIHQAVMKRFGADFYAGLGYYLDYHWDVEESGQANGEPSDASIYGLPKKMVSSGPVINFLYDNRKNAINADEGFYANLLYRPNLTILGSDNNWQSLTIDIRKYVPLSRRKRSILAFWSYNWLTPSGKPPYLDLPATGWDTYNNTGRGYIQARFRSENMLYLESEYRFNITRNGLFGGVAFANVQSFSDYPSKQFTKLWPAAGGGLRIRVNKHSNTNIAIDYGVGIDGSKGFFVNLGEVF